MRISTTLPSIHGTTLCASSAMGSISLLFRAVTLAPHTDCANPTISSKMMKQFPDKIRLRE
jgi:hypothetical protein